MDHHPALCRIGLEPELWRLTTIAVETPQEMEAYIAKALAARDAGTAIPFVIQLADGTIVGTTRFHSLVEEHRRLEIGFTWIASEWQRTFVNTEAKYLMLRHAFEERGIEWVEFRCHADNEPSRRALLRIGATEEGVLRRFMVSQRLGPRDVRLFSIIAPEWPAVREKLEGLLAR